MEKYPGKKKTAVFISGRGSNLKSLIKYSKKKNSLINIILVISNNPDAEGLKYASRSKIKIYGNKNKSNFENKSLKLLEKYKIDLICLAGFMRILSGNFIKKFSKPILNIHPSLLPKYKGLNIHKVTEKLDSGKVILQKKVKILKSDDVRSLEKKVLKIEHEIYPKAIDKFLTNL